MKTMVAAGWWPDAWDASEGEEVEYPEGEEGVLMGDARLSYQHDGGERCAWCGRPIQACVQDPCEHYRNG